MAKAPIFSETSTLEKVSQYVANIMQNRLKVLRFSKKNLDFSLYNLFLLRSAYVII